jgi:glycosyltransferase involved in cell wall biosynthesis
MKKIETIYNSVPPLPETSSRDELRRKFGVEEKKVILTAVRAVPWKGVDFLINVLRDLPPSHILVCASDGPMLETWKKQAADAGVSDRVRFLGRIDRKELAAWYRSADVFALATGYEGFPHVVIEAVSVGLPCIVSDKGGNPETAELYPGYVMVCAYRDTRIWSEALRTIRDYQKPARITKFEEMAHRVRTVLQDHAKTI